jgi:hypothetical protein
VLNPLTEIGIRMLVPICISCRQLVMNVLCCSEGREHQYQEDETERKRLRVGGHPWRHAA